MQKIIEEFSRAADSVGIIGADAIPVLIYCDPGVDDAVMLAYALANPRFAVLGIICSAGNTSVENTVMNALRICEVAGRTDIKVYAGAKGTLLSLQGGDSATLNGVHVYGAGGLGKTQMPVPKMEAQSGDATDFAVDTIIQSIEPVTIISTAGLTDVYLMLSALANKSEKNLDKIKVISMMGGALNIAVHANAPKHASSRWAEFNLIYDADASSRFFDFCAAHGKRIVMAPTDFTHTVLFSTHQVRDLRRRPQNRLISLVADLLADVPEWYREKFGHDNPSQPLHDLMAALCLCHPYLFTGEWTAVECSSNDADKPGLLVEKDQRENNNVFILSIPPQRIHRLFDCFFNDLAQSMPMQKKLDQAAAAVPQVFFPQSANNGSNLAASANLVTDNVLTSVASDSSTVSYASSVSHQGPPNPRFQFSADAVPQSARPNLKIDSEGRIQSSHSIHSAPLDMPPGSMEKFKKTF